MKAWLRRLGYLLLVLLWLVVMSLPALAFVLATQDQIQVGNDPARHLRLFLVSERDAKGIGVERANWAEHSDSCVQTQVNFLMWEGTGESVVHCQCFDDQGDVVFIAQNACE